MHIRHSKKFKKQYRKLAPKLQKKVRQKVEIFETNPHHHQLYNHALQGQLKGKRAIAITGDLRIIFEEHDNYTLVIMLDVGTHSQVYGKE